VELAASPGFLSDRFLGLALGSDKQDVFALRGRFGDIAHGVFEQLQGLLEIDDVDSVAFAKDVFLHLWIPALGLVPEMNACFEQFLHADRRQYGSFCLTVSGEKLRSRGPSRNLPPKGLVPQPFSLWRLPEGG